MRRLSVWSRNRRALSPVFATILLATIVIVFGSVSYYYSNNLTQTVTNNYVNTVTNSQQAISERIGFEKVAYDQSSATLRIYILNCGSANNVKINTVFIYDANHNVVPPPHPSTPNFALYHIDDNTQISSGALNTGQEAYFTVSFALGTILPSGYNIQLITQSGSTFVYGP